MTDSSVFETVVEQIMITTGCDRAKAAHVAQLNGHKPPQAIEDARRADVLEKQEQAEVMKLFRNFGFTVYSLSQARASKQTPGIPDLWCMHGDARVAFWWETKRQVGGRLSEAQSEFRELCTRLGVGHGYGDRHAARTHLINLGLAHVVHGALEPIREGATCR